MYSQGYCVDGKHIKVEGILPLDYHVVPPVLWEVKNIIRDVRPDKCTYITPSLPFPCLR